MLTNNFFVFYMFILSKRRYANPVNLFSGCKAVSSVISNLVGVLFLKLCRLKEIILIKKTENSGG